MSSTPPLTSDACIPSSSQDLVSSSGPHTPHEWRNTVRFLHCAFDSDEDDGDDDAYGHEVSKLRGGKMVSHRVPLTPTRSSRVNRATQTSENAQVSPSRFIVKGTVTPSRAAPLFARFATGSNGHRKRLRPNVDVGRECYEEMDWADENVEDNFSTPSSSPTKSPSLRRTKLDVAHHQCSTSFVPNLHDALPPLMPLPISLARRSHMIHTNSASMVHALRSNNLAHLSYASSSRGTPAYAIAGRGVLSAARCLGASMAGSHRSLSQRSFYQSFCTTSTPSKDLFTLQSGQDEQRFSHPLCAEYAHSARCLSGSRSQWLALGSNEGRISLLDTSGESTTGTFADTPGWQAHDGSVFEVKWRSDDEQIASGGSDYNIRVWDTSSGRELRTFSGHRGTPRTVAWDPDGRGYLLASGGRDGGIHVYDTRTTTGGTGDPVISVWSAHASTNETNGRRRRKGKADAAGGVRGITSLAYVPGRAAHTLCSAGCGDGTLKLWDLRNVAGTPSPNIDHTSSTAAAAAALTLGCIEQSVDVSTHQRSQNKSSHGVSSIVATSTKIFAACTDGCIYMLPTASLYDPPPSTALGIPSVPLFDVAQRGNTLYARMSMHDDERTLALGCNSGVITIWDTYAASSAASELAALGEDMTKVRIMGESLTGYAEGHEYLLEYAKPAILRGGHRSNFEINAVSWAHTQHGPTLASVSDDFTVRLWCSSNNL